MPFELLILILFIFVFFALPLSYSAYNKSLRKNQSTADWLLGDTLELYDDSDFGYTSHVIYKGLYKDKVIVLQGTKFVLISKEDIERNVTAKSRKETEISKFLETASQNYVEFQKEIKELYDKNDNQPV